MDPDPAANASRPMEPVVLPNLARLAAQQAAQDDLTRRSDSPILSNVNSSTPRSPGSASVSGVGSRIAISPLSSTVNASSTGVINNGTKTAVGQGNVAVGAGIGAGIVAGQNMGTGVSKEGLAAPTDSISLGQLKTMTVALPKPKKSMYTFPSPPPDTSDLLSELEEFYSYVEINLVVENQTCFLENWPHHTDFIETSKELQVEYIQKLLGDLPSPEYEVRYLAARQLLHIVQGTWASSTSPEHQLHLVLSHTFLLRSSSALLPLWSAVKETGLRWDKASSTPDVDPAFPQHSSHARQESLDGINAELAVLLAILYFMLEVFRGDEGWADELMQLEPPMPVYLFNLVAALREKNAKGYPVKKVLLLLWKSILSTLGGMKDAARVKLFVREVEGLPPDATRSKDRDNRPDTKVAPEDYQSYNNEIVSKYPSYQPPPTPYGDLDRLADAAAPIPVRTTFSYHINTTPEPASASMTSSNSTRPPPPPPIPGTPAPTPPPSPPPKAKKQQFQTDQTRPFILPFSPANAGPKGRPRVVPQSIEEAGDLYRKNMRVSTELWQTWKLREEYMADESGILKAEAVAASFGMGEKVKSKGKGKAMGGIGGGKEDAIRLSRRMEALSMDDDEEPLEKEQDRMDPLVMLQMMAKKMQAEEEAEADEKKKKLLRQRRVDVQRLEKVEVLYRAVLPNLQSAVIVLLKLLLATVTATNSSNQTSQNDSVNDPIVELNLEETDIMRHREITSKAVSAILMLTLKWFKTSHVMKFHYLSQLLVDSNCLLLILKMFGLQEVTTSVRTKNDKPEMNFFKYCQDRNSSSSRASPRPEDAMLEANPVGARPTSPKAGDDDEIELITDFSWRNFFSIINFVHILQKLTKRKTHRVLLLVQYKSSAVLKRILKVCHPTLQLYVLKVIKSQVPYCGRKWRQANMKVITAIYLHCRPDLRDEWLTGIDIDNDVEESLPHEQALRALVRYFNTKHYGIFAPHLHRKSSSSQGNAPDFGGPPSPNGNTSDNDVFPPRRSMTSFDHDNSFRSAHGHDPLDDLGDYEVDDILNPRLDREGEYDSDPLASRETWDRLGDIMGVYDEDISDSESVRSFGFLNFGDDGSDGSVSDFDIEEMDEQKNLSDWGQISPETISALEIERNASTSPGSPRPRVRRTSTGGPVSPALRPVLIDRDDDGRVEELGGPIAMEPHVGKAVDEVELIFGE